MMVDWTCVDQLPQRQNNEKDIFSIFEKAFTKDKLETFENLRAVSKSNMLEMNLRSLGLLLEPGCSQEFIALVKLINALKVSQAAFEKIIIIIIKNQDKGQDALKKREAPIESVYNIFIPNLW